MARSTRAERAQLLLITALALAVILVTVALLLNAAIFTENTATRDTTADGPEATELRGEVVAGIGELIETENREGSGDPGNISEDINTTSEMVDRERARGGTIATVSYNEDATAGSLLGWTNDSAEFNAIDNETLVDDLSDARAFELSLEAVVPLDDPNATQIEDNAFGVQFITPGDTVTQYIYEDGGTVSIATATGGADPQTRCTIDENGTTTVDLSGDELRTDTETRECYRGLWPDDDPDSIEFINGADTEGAFTLTVDDGADPTDDDDVSVDNAVYSLTVDIGYQSQDLTFETTARIAPGEPR